MSVLRSESDGASYHDSEQAAGNRASGDSQLNLLSVQWQASPDAGVHYRNGASIVASLGLSPELANEVFDDSILIAQEKIDRGEYEVREAKLTSWLYQFAWFAALGILRVETRHAKHQTDLTEQDFDLIRDPQLTPEDQVLVEFDQVALHRLVDQLPADLRIPLLLRYWGDLNAKEIAERLGIESGAVRARLFRARNQLRKVMV